MDPVHPLHPADSGDPRDAGDPRDPGGYERADVAARRRRNPFYLPVNGPDGTECDAAGGSEEHGRRLMTSLPRAGAVFAVGRRWWWVVPSQSQVGLEWPATAHYWAGAGRPRAPRRDRPTRAGRPAAPPRAPRSPGGPGEPRLIHWPSDAAPYTHPLLLYIAVCRLSGVPPVL
ncbi:hypothetical protein [Streptomyces specialis]|uniref:hypothetical protein n=1 Tax=Streptomyces specialis TaxID=498367 RepID=UPI00131D3001|nr:hypothetical protein [Streptomyces specialis]